MTEPKRTWSFFKKGKLLIADLLERARQALHDPVMRACIQHVHEDEERQAAMGEVLSEEDRIVDYWLTRLIERMTDNKIFQVNIQQTLAIDGICAWTTHTNGADKAPLKPPLDDWAMPYLRKAIRRRGSVETILPQIADPANPISPLEFTMYKLNVGRFLVGVGEATVIMPTHHNGVIKLMVYPKLVDTSKERYQRPSIPPASLDKDVN